MKHPAALLLAFLPLHGAALFAAGPVFPNESLDYSINWQSGLSLGDVHWKAQNAGSAAAPAWNFHLDYEANVPGYGLADAFRSDATAAFCTEDLSRDLVHGARKFSETETVDAKSLTVTRTPSSGSGESKFTVPDCVRDALTFLFFARHELVNGRVPDPQSVLFGALYQVKMTYLGSGPVKAGDRSYDADRVGCSIVGPASNINADIYFARDAVRTPVLIRFPVALGTFSVELTH
ncbi:DUF3108 domain-containing protein [Nevskia soli]|jgi:hypothetical protein|uniref:DUF3108 domain-containing protein n=1 Tax=Nevskia soli TaxID=418856 RepID=UPI0015D8E369|nr:DUF3108 domain-containing protein [Nevskia soli]